MPRFGKAEIRNLTKVIESGCFCEKRGGYLDQFRGDFARALHARHAVTAATAMLLMQAIPGAIDAGAGDEIICDSPVQFHGIACLHNNVVPVWADVRKDNFLMDPESVEKKITKRTKAIWVTHLWGFPAEVDKLRKIADKHGIYLLEDCALALLARYKGKYVGNWGHIGTFSFQMSKQLPTGEGGMAIVNDDKLASELRKRLIFGWSPEVLSSNYQMTEFQAAVGVEQLKKIPGYYRTYGQGNNILDAAIADCSWLDVRKEIPGSTVAPYAWSCIFRGERKKIDYGVFKAALTQAGDGFHGCGCYGGGFYVGFAQRPAYLYSLFRNPEKFGKKGWPFGHKGIDTTKGLCPVAEDIIPRIITLYRTMTIAEYRKQVRVLRKAIKLAESGNVKPLTYSKPEKKVLELVKNYGPLEPMEVIRIFDKNKWEHFIEFEMLAIMEGLRDRFPYKLSHAGPHAFAYNDLS